jgi:hypothetical protein
VLNAEAWDLETMYLIDCLWALLTVLITRDQCVTRYILTFALRRFFATTRLLWRSILSFPFLSAVAATILPRFSMHWLHDRYLLTLV